MIDNDSRHPRCPRALNTDTWPASRLHTSS